MMRAMLRLWALIGVVLLSMNIRAASAAPLTVVADEWPPFSGAALPNGGISLDVISTVLTRAGYDVDTAVLPWARIMDGSRRGEYDIVGSLFYDTDIASYMTYGDPFYETEVHFVQQTGSGHTVTGLKSLEPYSIAVGDGFLYEDAFDRADHLNKVVVTTAVQALRMVAYGRADLTLDSVDVLKYAIKQDAPEIADRIEVLPYVLTTHDIHMALRSNHPDREKIVADFNATLAEMRTDGSLAELLSKHTVE